MKVSLDSIQNLREILLLSFIEILGLIKWVVHILYQNREMFYDFILGELAKK